MPKGVSNLYREKEVKRIRNTRSTLPINTKKDRTELERQQAINDQIFGTHKIHDLQNSSREFAKEWSPLFIRQDGQPSATGLKLYKERIQVVNEDARHIDHEIIPVIRPMRMLNGKDRVVYVQHVLATEQDCKFWHNHLTKIVKTIKEKDKRILDIEADLKGVKASQQQRMRDIQARAKRGGL